MNPNESEANTISKAVVVGLIQDVIKETDNAKNDIETDVTESLASVLESLTEESAREIVEKKDAKILSDKTSKIIAQFMGNEQTKGKL